LAFSATILGHSRSLPAAVELASIFGGKLPLNEDDDEDADADDDVDDDERAGTDRENSGTNSGTLGAVRWISFPLRTDLAATGSAGTGAKAPISGAFRHVSSTASLAQQMRAGVAVCCILVPMIIGFISLCAGHVWTFSGTSRALARDVRSHRRLHRRAHARISTSSADRDD
jgi:hypothetical protein